MKLTDEQRQRAKPTIEELCNSINATTNDIPNELFNTEEYRLFIFYFMVLKDAYDRNEFRER